MPLNTIQLIALQNELTNDPLTIGYVDVRSETDRLLRRLNRSKYNLAAAKIRRPFEELDVSDISAVIDSGEYAALGEYDKEWVKAFINVQDNARLKPYKPKLWFLFDKDSVTRAAIQSIRLKQPSRAEDLFGVNTVITRADFAAIVKLDTGGV